VALGAGAALSVLVALVVSGTGGAAGRVPAPVVSGLSASPVAVSAAGGPVSLSASVTGAATCTFSSKPALAGLPSTVDCAGGAATQSVAIPSTTKKKDVRYTVSLTATTSGGVRSRAAKTVVTEISAVVPTMITGTATVPGSTPSAFGYSASFAFVLDAPSCTVVLECSYGIVGLSSTMTPSTSNIGGGCGDSLSVPPAPWNGEAPSGSVYLGPTEPDRSHYMTVGFAATSFVPTCTYGTEFDHPALDTLWTPGLSTLTFTDPSIEGTAVLDFQYS
jgi:hypothetical protein